MEQSSVGWVVLCRCSRPLQQEVAVLHRVEEEGGGRFGSVHTLVRSCCLQRLMC